MTTLMFLNIISLVLMIAVISAGPYLYYYDRNDFAKKFRKVSTKAIIKGELNYVDLQDMAAYWQQDRESVLHNLRRFLYEHFNEENGLEDSYKIIRNLLDTHKENEASDELPENIYYQLDSIRDSLHSTEDKNKIKRLGFSLSPLYVSNSRKVLKERKWNYIVGILGTIVAITTIGQFITTIILFLSK